MVKGNRLIVEKLSVRFGEKCAVNGLSAEFRSGELVAILGPNGAGKTTFLRALAGIITPCAGEIMLNEKPLSQYGRLERARNIAWLGQGHEIYWPMRVERLIALGRLPHRQYENEHAVREAMAEASISHLWGRQASKISAGEKAATLMARMLAVQADIILADEPCASLDPARQLETMLLLKKRAGGGNIVIVILHDVSLAARFCDKVLLLHGGEAIAYGPPDKVLSKENMARAYGIEVRHIQYEGAKYVLPWKRLERKG